MMTEEMQNTTEFYPSGSLQDEINRSLAFAGESEDDLSDEDEWDDEEEAEANEDEEDEEDAEEVEDAEQE